MLSGRLRHVVIIQQPSSTSVDTMGFPTGGWSQYAERRASIDPVSARDLQVATDRFGEASHKVRMRYTAGVTADMRLLYRRTHTTLSSAIGTTSDVTIGVSDGSAFPLAPYRIRVEDEIMSVTAGYATTAWTVTRAVDGTSPTSHEADVDVHYLVIADLVGPPMVMREKKHEMTMMVAEQA